jgi:hypothetical protein
MCIFFLFRPRCGLTIVWRIFDCRGH